MPRSLDGDHLRLLLVHADDAEAAELTSRLRDGGRPGALEVVRARSLAEARAALADADFDLILMNLTLPDGSGLDAYGEMAPVAKFSPIVVLTGPEDDEMAYAAVRAGAQDAVAAGQVSGLHRAVRFASVRGRVLAGQAADLRRQELLLEFSQFGSEGRPLFDLAARVLAEGLAVERAVVLEVAADGRIVHRGSTGIPEGASSTVYANVGDGSWADTAATRAVDIPITIPGVDIDVGHWLVQRVAIRDHLWGLLGVWVPELRDELDREKAFLGQLAALLSRIVERQAADAAREKRVDELRALRTLARATVDDVHGDALAPLAAATLAAAMQFPEIAVANVELGDVRSAFPDGSDDPAHCGPHADIVVAGAVRGRLDIGYTQTRAFLPQEQEMVDAAAETLSAWLSRSAAFEELRDTQAWNQLQATALSASANAVAITAPDGTIEWVNDAFTAMSGYSFDTAVGSPGTITRSGEHEPSFFEDLWSTVNSGRIWHGHMLNRHADGSLYSIRQVLTPVMDDAGRIEHLVAIHENVTEIDAANQALETSRHHMAAIFATALDAIVLTDDDGRHIDVNPATEELTGHTRAELLAMGPSDLVGAASPGDPMARYAVLDMDGQDVDTLVLRHKDGHLIETEFRAVANIAPGVHLSMLRDVTARNKMVRRLEENETKFRQLAENATDIVAQLRVDRDSGMHVDYANPASADILGYSLERLHDDPDLLFSLFEDDVQREGVLKRIPTVDNPTVSDVVQLRRADGTPLWLDIHSTLSDLDTDPATIQIVAHDITIRQQSLDALTRTVRDQERAAERLIELNVMKDTFLQSVSHELRTPATVILGFAELLANNGHDIPAEQVQHFHQRMATSARRLKRLLDDLLDAERLARGVMVPIRAPVEMSDLVQQVVDDSGLDRRPITLELEPVTLYADRAWIERALGNLIHNVVRHTPPATPMSIVLRSKGDGAEVIVEDDGPGIPSDIRGGLLEPLEQGEASAGSADPGIGMGLTLAHALAKLHGGDLTITESANGGTRVTLSFSPSDPIEH